MTKETIFRKSLFGGFDRNQVIKYISYLTSHCPDTVTREEILKLNAYIKKLEALIVQRDAVIEDLKKQKSTDTINPVIISLQEIVQNGRKLKKSNEEIDAVTSSIQKEIDEKQPRIDSLLTKITSISTEIASIQSNLRAISAKLSEINFGTITATETSSDNCHTEEVTVTSIVTGIEEKVDADVQNDISEDEYDYPAEDDTEYVPLIIDNPASNSDEIINSIDNFFIELEKIADAQVFDLTTLLDNEDEDEDKNKATE